MILAIKLIRLCGIAILQHGLVPRVSLIQSKILTPARIITSSWNRNAISRSGSANGSFIGLMIKLILADPKAQP